MYRVLQRLAFFHFILAGGCNYSRLIELSQYVQLQEDIRSLVVFSQIGFTENLSEFDTFLRTQAATVPVVLINDKCIENESMWELLGSWSMAFVFMDKVDNVNMFGTVNRTLRHIHLTKIIFVLKDAIEDDKPFVQFFKTCLRLGIVNVVVVLPTQVLSYEPFPRVNLRNLTTRSMEEYFPDHLYDLKGYTFNTPIQQDGPRVFMVSERHDTSKISGINTEIFRSFVERHNATFERLANMTNQSSFEITDALRLLADGKVDILLHTYSYFDLNLYAWSYPIAQVPWQVMVPFVEEIPPYLYIVLPFDHKVWLCLAISFIYISSIGYITLSYCQHLTEYGPLFSRSLTQFLYMPSRAVPCTLRATLFEMQIFAYALIFTNIYLALLSAFLTTTVPGKQIDTFEELVASGTQIMTTNFEAGLIRHNAVYRPSYGEGIFQIEEIDLVNEYRKSLNRTYAFIMAEDRTKFFIGQQKYLEKKRMHISRNTLGTYFLTFTMQMDSPFQKNFDAIVLQLYQTGLFMKWETDVFDLAVSTKYLQIFRSEHSASFRPLTTLHLAVCWVLYAGGIALAFVGLLVEHIRARFG